MARLRHTWNLIGVYISVTTSHSHCCLEWSVQIPSLLPVSWVGRYVLHLTFYNIYSPGSSINKVYGSACKSFYHWTMPWDVQITIFIGPRYEWQPFEFLFNVFGRKRMWLWECREAEGTFINVITLHSLLLVKHGVWRTKCTSAQGWLSNVNERTAH